MAKWSYWFFSGTLVFSISLAGLLKTAPTSHVSVSSKEIEAVDDLVTSDDHSFSPVLESSPAADSVLPTVIPRGHSHNDYKQLRPFFDAIDNGFCSVEADVFLEEGQLLVGHGRLELTQERTLESLYLKPLQERSCRFNGRVCPNADQFYLWIELKTEAQSTYTILREVLQKYENMLTSFSKEKKIQRAVTIILTGKANIALIANETVRYAMVDGNANVFDSDISSDLIPTISLNWRDFFDRFDGQLSPEDHKKLRLHVRKAHEKQRKLRYWNAPDYDVFWNILYEAHVDFINTDKPRQMQDFLKNR